MMEYASSQNGCGREIKQTQNIAFWIREYLLHRGQVRMANLATLRPMLAALREAVENQDKIGWIEFLHGKVTTMF